MHAIFESTVLIIIGIGVISLGVYADVLKRTALGYVRNR